MKNVLKRFLYPCSFAAVLITITCVLCSSVSVKNVSEMTPDGGMTYYLTLDGEDCTFAHFAEYGVYVPESKAIRGVLVLQHGCTMEQFGITRSYDLQYRAFARKWNLAVVETALHGDCHIWQKSGSGSIPALIKVLNRVGNEVGHPELASVPWLLFGHSGGGYWVLSTLHDYPEKILAAVCYSAAWDPQWEYSQAAAEVPVLMRHAGQNDAPTVFCEATAIHTFARLRGMGAPASVVRNVGQNHNLSMLRHMSIPFYESALRHRLASKNGKPFRKVNLEKGYLADTLTFEVAKAKDFKGDKNSACLFYDDETALKWKEFATTNDVVDLTPPSAPYCLETRVSEGGEVELSWKASADVESGIECFKIYCDGALVGRVPENGTYQAFDRNGDNTYPIKPAPMSFTLTGLGLGKHIVEVEMLNQSGLASKKAHVRVSAR